MTGPLGAAVKVAELGQGLRGSDAPKDTADKIAGGHAYEKHVSERGEFPGIESREEFAKALQDILRDPSASKDLKGDRKAYWDAKTGTIVITNPKDPDGGTAFKPSDGKKYFDDLR